jgi:hypothetical protein
MRFAIYGLLFAALVFLISGGHFVFLRLLFLLPLGGMFGHRRRHGHPGIAERGGTDADTALRCGAPCGPGA